MLLPTTAAILSSTFLGPVGTAGVVAAVTFFEVSAGVCAKEIEIVKIVSKMAVPNFLIYNLSVCEICKGANLAIICLLIICANMLINAQTIIYFWLKIVKSES